MCAYQYLLFVVLYCLYMHECNYASAIVVWSGLVVVVVVVVVNPAVQHTRHAAV